jgi:hypothetical protein
MEARISSEMIDSGEGTAIAIGVDGEAHGDRERGAGNGWIRSHGLQPMESF